MAKTEARRYRRISLNLPAHITVNTVDEYEGRLLNISPGGLAVMAETNASVGDAVSIRITGLDEIEGTIARLLPDGLGVSFRLSKSRRARLTEQLMLRVNEKFGEGLGDRRFSLRHRGSSERIACRLADGASLYVKLIDNSVDGISVEAPRKPAIGAEIHVGRRRGIVIRHTPRGFVVVYEAAAAEQTRPNLRAI
ncbi:MAG: PilZ domain-containing protein [Pseudomonadota bacterium]